MANRALKMPPLKDSEAIATPSLTSPAPRATPLLSPRNSRIPDLVFQALVMACGAAVLAIVGLIIYELVTKSALSWHAFGFKFFVGNEWDPVNDHYGALPFLYGTLVSSLLALVISVPLAVGVAVFITEMSPRWLKAPLAATTWASPGSPASSTGPSTNRLR